MTAFSERSDAAGSRTGVFAEVPLGCQILIVGDDPSVGQLEAALQRVGMASATAKSMTEACEWVISGRFQAVLSQPLLSDGSWRRLIDIANHYDLRFEVVVFARDFDLAAWAESLNDGAFDVLDTVVEMPRVAEVSKRALWAAYLKGAGPNPEANNPQKVA